MRTLLTLNICLMCHVQYLDLSSNQIGNDSLSALAKAITPGPNGKGALPKCIDIGLTFNPASDEAKQAVLDASQMSEVCQRQ